MAGRIRIGRIFLSGILFAIIAQIIYVIVSMLTLEYYMIEKYFPVWSKIMMPTAGPPPASFYLYSILFSIIAGILFAFVYVVIREGIPGKSILEKGLTYGLLVFFVGGIPGYLATYLLINLPTMLIFYWSIEGLVIDLLGGVIIAWINR